MNGEEFGQLAAPAGDKGSEAAAAAAPRSSDLEWGSAFSQTKPQGPFPEDPSWWPRQSQPPNDRPRAADWPPFCQNCTALVFSFPILQRRKRAAAKQEVEKNERQNSSSNLHGANRIEEASL